jgi:hypothetical protein
MALTITPTTQPANTPPRTLLTVDTTGYTGKTLASWREIGGVQTPVRDAETTPDIEDVTWVGYDYEAPFGVSCTYLVVVYDGSVSLTSAVSAAVSLAVTDVWLIHPGDSSLSVQITVKELGERKRGAPRSAVRVLGRSTPVVTTGARMSVQSVVAVYTTTLVELDGVHACLADGQTLLLNIPDSLGWGVGAEWVSCTETGEQRVVPMGQRPQRVTAVPYVVVERPEGDLLPSRTWADVVAEAGTWADLLASRATWLDVLLGS